MKKKMLFFLVLSLCLSGLLVAADVENPDAPLKGDWDLKAKKLWEVSNYEKEGMAKPAIGAVLDDETLCVYDEGRAENYLFDSNGKFIAGFGKKGEGTGEVRSQRNVFAGEGKIIIMDYFLLHYFSNTGKYLKTVWYTKNWGFPTLFINDDEYLSFNTQNTFEIQWVDLAKGSFKSIKEITSFQQGVSFKSEHGTITILLPCLTPLMECAFDQKNKKLYYGSNDSYTIYAVNQEGIVSDRFSIKREKRDLTNRMKKILQKEIEILTPEQWKSFSSYLTYFHKIQILDEFIFVYVVYFGQNWKEQQIDIFSLDGKYLYRTVFKPGNEEEIYSTLNHKVIIKNGFLYASLLDKDGKTKVAKYQVSLPKM